MSKILVALLAAAMVSACGQDPCAPERLTLHHAEGVRDIKIKETERLVEELKLRALEIRLGLPHAESAAAFEERKRALLTSTLAANAEASRAADALTACVIKHNPR